jgi:hypothetical protein
MGNLRTFAVVAAAVACGACESTVAPPAGDPFLGGWTCDETRTLTFATPAGTPDASAKTRYSLVVSTSNGKLSAYAQNEAGATCKLDYNEMDKSAVLVSGQSCMDGGGMTLIYKMGTADITTVGLLTNLAFDFSGTIAQSGGAAAVDATGSGTVTSTCWKTYTGGGAGVGGGGW